MTYPLLKETEANMADDGLELYGSNTDIEVKIAPSRSRKVQALTWTIGLMIAFGLVVAMVFFIVSLVTKHPNYKNCKDFGDSGFFRDISDIIHHNPSQKNYGVSITDVDQDGTFEAVICGYGYSNLVFKYDDDTGKVQDIAKDIGIQASGRQSIGIASCDIDGDGNEEIYVLNTDSYSGTKNYGDNLYHLNDDDTTFYDVFELDENSNDRNSFAGRSVACVDRTGEGIYGVAASSYGAQLHLYEASLGSVDIKDIGGPNKIGFEGVTGGRGLTGGALYPHKNYAETPGMDMILDNENSCNYFFKNNGNGEFTEVSAEMGMSDCNENGRGITLMDANSDGKTDIVYGNWDGPHRMFLQRDSHFEDVASSFPPFDEPTLIRTVIAADFDNDGYEEVFMNNICSYGYNQPNFLYRTEDGSNWHCTDIGDALELDGYGTGGAVTDFDGDGYLELIVAHGESSKQPVTLYTFSGNKDNNWIRIIPKTQHGAPARGSVVELVQNNVVNQIRTIDPGSGYLNQMEPVAHFGLGKATKVDKIIVTWVDGTVQNIAEPEINMVHTIEYPES